MENNTLYDTLKNTVDSLGYVWFEGDLNLNILLERVDEVITDKFSDWGYIVYTLKGKKYVEAFKCTTKPGIKGSIDSPITYKGVTGTAIIIPGQYLSVYKFLKNGNGSGTIPWGYPYFSQIGGINYWRDGNKDLIIDHVQEQDDEVFGTNGHLMSGKYNDKGKMVGINDYGTWREFGIVGNWSKGCWGAQKSEWDKILPIINNAINIYGDVFSFTLFETKDLVK